MLRPKPGWNEEASIHRPLGNLTGLKTHHYRALERLYRRKVPPAQLLTPELARQLAEISAEVHRQIGVLVDRQGAVAYVIVGDAKGLLIPDLPRARGVKGRLKGLRLIHTHLDLSPLSQDDFTDLALLRLDAVAALAVAGGQPGAIEIAHLLPQPVEGQSWAVIKARQVGALTMDFEALVASLEAEFSRLASAGSDKIRERAILIGVTGANRVAAEDSLEELKELARSAGLNVAATILQRRPRFDPRFLMGKGRLSELVIQALQQGVDMLVFDAELSPSQVRSITNFSELKVIDRTQLILDLFAQRARSREGKLQVEMAQVKYLLPRLVGKGDALSRLMGGSAAGAPASPSWKWTAAASGTASTGCSRTCPGSGMNGGSGVSPAGVKTSPSCPSSATPTPGNPPCSMP